MTKFTLNGSAVSTNVAAGTPLLWVIRDELALKGTKFGCGAGLCGACTVHVDDKPVRSCVLPISAVADASVTTIEGLFGEERIRIQKAWVQSRVSQCGYCQTGMIMAATALLRKNPTPSNDDIDRQITNICRCGTYPRVRDAIKSAAAERTSEAEQ